MADLFKVLMAMKKKCNKKNGKREMRITFQGLSGNLNPYNHPDCNHVEVLNPPVKRTGDISISTTYTNLVKAM